MAQLLLSNFTPPGSNSSYKFRAGALFFGTTSGSGTAMTVNIPGVTEYYTGLTLILTMGVQSASGCTLQVNNLDPVPMIYGASQTGTYFTSGATYIFVYDGTNFKGVHSYNSDTTYSALTEADGQAGTATTGRLITAKTLKNLINYHAPTKTGTGASGTWGINITGNAATATKFDTATNVTLTGDITGSSSSQKGWNIKTTIGEGKVTNAMLAGSISNDKLANSYFTIKEGSIDHNISLGGQVLSKDLATWLGLSKIMSFVGISNDAKLVNGYTGTPTIKEGQTNYTTKTPGDTVLHETTGKQFIWTGTSWYEIGNGLLYDLQGTAAGLIATLDVNDTDGGTNNFVSAVKQTDGKINVTHKALVTTGKWAGEAGSVAWANITGKPSAFTPSEHTHNYAGSSSAGGSANSAIKVNNNLIIKLNNGSTEGTNLFTFNGSTAKTINITPAAIGAAAASHGTHVSYGTTASAISTAASAGTATTVSRSDHVHSLDKATVVAALGYTPPVENHNHDSSYVKKSGDTMTGTLNLPNLSFNNGSGMLYADDGDTTTVGGLVMCSSTEGWYGGCGLSLRDCSSSNDAPGTFILKAQKVKGSTEDHYLLVGHADSGVLDWTGTNFSVLGNGRLGPTGHTISTNGSIGAGEEIYAIGGFYAGGTSSIYLRHNDNWWPVIHNHGNSNVALNACGGGIYLGWNNTTHICYGNNGVRYGEWTGNRNQIWSLSTGHHPWSGSALEIRECQSVGSNQSDFNYAPKIGFHWANRQAGILALEADGVFRFRLSDDAGNLATVQAGSIWGAVWNDYAEFRICNEDFKPGQVVLENGDDTLSIASKRLQRGCSIISDTFGFSIGKTYEAKCPIAVSGRVLAYGYESREEFKKHIGWPVCSGPNGTVSIMTEEEEEKYPSRIIGTISAVPDYETWGTGNVEVNNRIWIKVK